MESESWTINKFVRNCLDTAEKWFYRGVMKILCTDKKVLCVLRETKSQKELVTHLLERQFTFLDQWFSVGVPWRTSVSRD